ncbi:TVP38/TMEM64 family protein [Bacillus testis]|uniref:TVP38/TMEM64 family protein n=1 Tax=Bacillus testis TaxID=1622072 RepID=UPI00067F16A7|nr:VTT domain-containing protein [Bacillus testis]
MIGQLTLHALTENIDSVLVSYKGLGLVKISALLFMEAFFPLIPICGLVILNAAAYGFTEGLLLSYIGSLAGNWALYAIFYYFGHFSFFTKLKQKEKIKTYAGWMEKRGVGLIALCCLIPIIINSIVAMLAGINRIPFGKFAFASALGIFGLFLILSYIGASLTAMSVNYWEIGIILSVVAFLAWLGWRIQHQLSS